WMQLLGLMADPVEVIRNFLERYPEIQVAPGMPLASMLLQFNVYLPQFSSPALHWHAIWQGSASSLWPAVFENEAYRTACMRMAFIVIVNLLIVGFLVLRKSRINK
ncbi:hypothetical protein K8I31_19705, partial [bacterium]|nr:hypothetical protein [bacterium]